MSERPGDMVSTYVEIAGLGGYPFMQCSHVIHRRDLSDLGEPYLSAVKAARERHDQATGRAVAG